MRVIENIQSRGKGSQLRGNLLDQYHQEELKFHTRFCSCGTNVSHMLYDTGLSVSQEQDQFTGYEGYLWANDRLISALQYANMTINKWQKKMVNYKEKWTDFDWVSACTPLVMLYNARQVIEVSEYHEFGRDSKTFTHSDPNEFLGEHAIRPEYKDKIIPMSCLIGKPLGNFNEQDLFNFKNNSLAKLETKWKKTEFIYLPNVILRSAKPNKSCTGTSTTSSVGLQILKEIINK